MQLCVAAHLCVAVCAAVFCEVAHETPARECGCVWSCNFLCSFVCAVDTLYRSLLSASLRILSSLSLCFRPHDCVHLLVQGHAALSSGNKPKLVKISTPMHATNTVPVVLSQPSAVVPLDDDDDLFDVELIDVSLRNRLCCVACFCCRCTMLCVSSGSALVSLFRYR